MCVEQTRFDPRRSADAEQLLFNAIPDALATLTHSEEASLSVSGYDFKISRTGLEFVGKRLMTAVEGASGAVSVDGLLAGLPGAVFDSTASLTTLVEAAEQILGSRAADAELSRISRAKVENRQEAENPSSEANVKEVSQEPEQTARNDNSTARPSLTLPDPRIS